MKARNLRTGEEDYAAELLRFADALDAAAPQVAAALSVDTERGTVSWIEVHGAAANIRRWAARGPDLIAGLDRGPKPSATPGIEIVTCYSPFPLLGSIAPWNFPVILSHIDAVPALMAGCAAMACGRFGD